MVLIKYKNIFNFDYELELTVNFQRSQKSYVFVKHFSLIHLTCPLYITVPAFSWNYLDVLFLYCDLFQMGSPHLTELFVFLHF